MSDPGSTDRLAANALHVCLCFSARKAARSVTQHYDRFFERVGLKSTQFSLLLSIYVLAPIKMSELAQTMVMDRTTLSRNLKPLSNAGYVKSYVGKDKRVRKLAVSDNGRAILLAAIPVWQQAQERLVSRIGEARATGLLSAFETLGEIQKPRI